jgi:hypothetical protein
LSNAAGDILNIALGAATWVPMSFGATRMVTNANFGIDATYAYFSGPQSSQKFEVLRVPLAGGSTSLVATLSDPALVDAVDSAGVYITNAAFEATVDDAGQHDVPIESVYVAPLMGGTPTTLAAGQYQVTSTLTDASFVYWVDLGTGFANDGAIRKVSRTGGGLPTTLASGLAAPFEMAADDTNLYFITIGTDVALSDGGSSQTNGALMAVPKSGGTTSVLVPNLVNPSGVAVDATNVYVVLLGQVDSGGMPVDNTGSVMRVAKSGGTPTTIASGEPAPMGVAVDNTFVYWTDFGTSARAFMDGSVRRLGK